MVSCAKQYHLLSLSTSQMEGRMRDAKFWKRYPFLGIYEPKQTLNDSSFHFYTEPQPGYHRVSLHRRSAKKQLTMYYEQVDSQQCNRFVTKSQVVDSSEMVDPEYFSIKNNIMHDGIVVDRGRVGRESEWVRKYQPKKFVELLSDDKINRNLLTWLKNWDGIAFNKCTNKKNIITPLIFNRHLHSNVLKSTSQNNYFQSVFNNPRKLLLLAGSAGCGKTTLIRVLGQHCKYNVVEINASDDRAANNLISKIEDIANNDTIRGNNRPALICLDEIDGVSEGEITGITKLLDYIENGKKPKPEDYPQKSTKQGITEPKQKQKIGYEKFGHGGQGRDRMHNNGNQLNRPIVFICNDPFVKGLKQLRKRAHVVYFPELSSERIVQRMKQILNKQKIYIEMAVLQKICQICKNDIRSCVGILELVAKQKKMYNKNPKDIIMRMKVSFMRDNQASINQFLGELFSREIQKRYEREAEDEHFSINFVKYMENEVMAIANPSLLMQTFMQNLLLIPGIIRKQRAFIYLYRLLGWSDVLIKNGFRYQNQLENYHALPYMCYALSFSCQDVQKVEFPNLFFQRLKRYKWNREILKSIYSNIPIQLKFTISKEAMVGCYMLALYLGMQASTPKQAVIIRCVSLMLTYGFSLKKDKEYHNNTIFNPEIDILLTFGTRRPQVLVSNHIKILMEQNYQFFKQRKQMLSDNEMRNNSVMMSQLQLSSRKKRIHDVGEGLRYRYVEGTGTKTSYNLIIGYFF